ncbi:MAG: metal-dependent hydrolase [Bacteroidia bacterium]|nr:metal-dependent hydrolase [Bacteroidia bacterium]
MDSLTQIVLGASVGEATLGRKVGNKAMLWGAIAGTIPDLDVIGRSFLDDVTALEWHRGFSHSLVFCLIAAPLMGWLVHRIYRRKNEASVRDWSLLMFLCFVTHPLLDCHTTWGTQFFWPFDLRIAYNNINVVDPIYTLPFLVLVLMALFARRGSARRKKLNRLGLIISSVYMVITIALKGVTYQVFKTSLDDKEVDYVSISNRPTMFNSILWTANVETKDSFLIGYYSLLDEDQNIQYRGYAKHQERIDDIRDEEQIKRLIYITKGWYLIQEKDGKRYLCDLRFGEMGDGTERFVFTHELREVDGEWQVHSIDPEFEFDNMWDYLGPMFDRMLGNK